MRSGWVAVAAVAACYHATDYSHCSDCVRDAEAGSDGVIGVDSADTGPLCFGHSPAEGGLLKVCPTRAPSAIDIEQSKTIFTDSTTFCELIAPVDGPGPMVCVATATTVYLAATVEAYGPYPFVIVATDAIDVEGALSVGSHVRAATPGAGGGRDCGAGSGTLSVEGGGGGAGGSFGSVGGAGGSTLAGSGGVAASATLPGGFIGGCNGGGGGGGGSGNGGATPGAYGGGALALISKTKIQIASAVIASGAGGAGGGNVAGGAGGGAGGMVLLDAPEIDFQAGYVAATGGGGGQGGGASPGGDGADPVGIGTAMGGSGVACNGRGSGGNGAATADATNGVSTNLNSCAAGGGGGGYGFIHTKGQMMGSPVTAPAILPL